MAAYVYVDSSALVKLVVEEPETSALQADIANRAGLLCSAIGATELLRACRRALSRKQLGRATEVLDAVFLIDVTPAILSAAAELSPPELRTLDAIATVQSLDERDVDVITYDGRLRDAARHFGLHVLSPGAT